MMSRKHFEGLANLVLDFGAIDADIERAYKRLAERVGDFCEADNPRFDRVRFNEACGLELNCEGMWQLVENIR